MNRAALSTPARLAAFLVVLAVVFGGATAVGNAVGPVRSTTAAGEAHAAADTHSAGSTESDDTHAGGDSHDVNDADTAESRTRGELTDDLPDGLAVSQQGYTLRLDQTELTAGQPDNLRFVVDGPEGEPLTAYTPTHDKELHLIVVSRDLTSFQHLHPVRDDAGTWTVPLTVDAPGQYRVLADLAPGRSTKAMTLGADLFVAGDYQPRPLPAPQRIATVGDYTVRLDGELVAGKESKLTLTVSKAGRPVTDLQPYLAAYGHLVVLRKGDLAYLHVHPGGVPGDGRTAAGPAITFFAKAPTSGDYRLFLDFRHQDVVRTAQFTARATPASPDRP